MHKTEIFPEVMNRLAKWRGNGHVFDDLEPAKTALVVIDMQNCWVMEGQPGYSPPVPTVVPNINRLAAALRQAGATVIWIQVNHSVEVTAKWQRFRDFFPNEVLLRAWSEALTPGNIGYELWAGLDVKPGDLKLEKLRFSCFIQGSSNLEAELKKRAIDTVLLAGVSTNVCCESTARDGQMLNYKMVMVSDGCATRTDAEHNATLSNLIALFADVMTTDEVIARLKPAARAQAA